MARFTLEDFSGRDPELVYIAGNLGEVERVEAALDAQKIDYAMNIENYEKQSFLGGTYPGVFFYVAEGDALRSRECLQGLGLTGTIAPD